MIPLVGRPHLEKHMHPVKKRIRFYSPSTYTRVCCFPGRAWVNTELAICLKPRWLQRNEFSPLILLSQVVDLPPLLPASKKPSRGVGVRGGGEAGEKRRGGERRRGKDGVVTSLGSQFPQITQQLLPCLSSHTKRFQFPSLAGS